jgi:Leucine-rich repeat (LRR) protein
LKKLDLSGNHLSKLPGGTLDGLESLEELDLSNNFLSAIPVDALKPLKKLKRLILHSNRIRVCSKSSDRNEQWIIFKNINESCH